METTLTTAGIACIIAAIVGGGLKAFAIEIPALDSVRRQAALGVFGVLLIATGFGWNSISTARSELPSEPSPTGSSSPPASSRPAGAAPVSTEVCSAAWFANPAPQRVTIIESGTADAEVLGADQPKDDPVVVVLTEDGKPVGAIAFRLYTSNDLFKITQVVDDMCARLETFRNESRGGDRYSLQNWDTVELTFGPRQYALRLGYSAGSIGARVTRLGTVSSGRPLSREDCLAWFRTPPPDRVTVIESGGAGVEVLAPDQPKDRPLVIVLADDGKPIGAVALKLFVSNALFKISQVVSARCEQLETFRNSSRGGDRYVLQNYDSVELVFGTQKYSLSLGYGSGSVSGHLDRV